MLNNLKLNLKTECGLTTDEVELAMMYFLPEKIQKGEKIVDAGEMCEYAIFVEKGCLRSYVINNKYKESTMYLFPDNSWVPDIQCYLKRHTSNTNWDAIENSFIFKLHISSYEKLKSLIPSFPLYFQSLQYSYLMATQQRLLTTLCTKAEDRYQNFLEQYPMLSRRLPINLIASYIGIAPESLSRIRKQSIKK